MLASAPGFATVVNGTLDSHSTAVPGGRPVVQLHGLCSDSALALDLCVETALTCAFLPDLRAVQVEFLCI